MKWGDLGAHLGQTNNQNGPASRTSLGCPHATIPNCVGTIQLNRFVLLMYAKVCRGWCKPFQKVPGLDFLEANKTSSAYWKQNCAASHLSPITEVSCKPLCAEIAPYTAARTVARTIGSSACSPTRSTWVQHVLVVQSVSGGSQRRNLKWRWWRWRWRE